MQPHNAISWYEIPVPDGNRARTFYETIFEYNGALEYFNCLPGCSSKQ